MSEDKLLKETRHLDCKIDTKLRQLHRLRNQIGSLKSFDYSRDRIQESNRQGSQIEDLVIKICDLEAEITKDIDNLVDRKEKVRKVFNAIEGLSGAIMEMRYLENKCWQEIADILHISEQYAYELHNKELKKLKRTE